MFTDCTSLRRVPKDLLAWFTESRGKGAQCTSMFTNCTALTSAPDLCCMNPGYYTYYKMFSSCRSLSTAPSMDISSLLKS